MLNIYMIYIYILLYVNFREHGMPGDRRGNVSASVAMVHSVPELIVSEQVRSNISIYSFC